MSNPSTDLARAVVSALLEAGVTEVVLSPGSRNAPLSFAVHDAAAAGALRLHTRIDERTAGFLALGLTRVGSRAAVMCTSGSAVANLAPAAVEAAHAGVPLLVVTADRPARLRGTGANQTTDQLGLLGPLVPVVDVASPSDIPPLDGLLHLDVQLEEPLVPGAVGSPRSPADRGFPRFEGVATPSKREERPPSSGAEVLPSGPRTVVVAGDDAGPPARVLAERGNWPLLAEPSSGSRTGTHAIRCYRLLLDTDLGRLVERVVVAGHPTLSRPVSRLLARDDVEVVELPARGAWPGRPFAVATSAAAYEPEEKDESGWFEEWRDADRRVGRALDDLLRDEPGLTPHEVAGAVARALPPEGLLHVGASNPIRDLDLMVPVYEVGARRKVVANRGLSGIDGTISSAIGAALGRPSSSRAFALMGDVTFLHDMTGLVLGPEEPRPDLTIVVVNDDGGSIFAGLEQGAEEYADRYERLFGTPHGVDLASLCAATRTPHWRVETITELEHALASPNGGIEVVEAVVRRHDRRDLDARIRALPAHTG